MKTIKVRDLVDSANQRMANPKLNQDEKRVIYLFVDDFLHRTKNYAGFGYQDGVIDRGKGIANPDREYDRFFYYHRNIKS